MPKLIFKKFMPDHDMIKNHKNLQFLGEKLHDPNYWHLNRRSISIAFAVGLLVAWIPVPGQMIIAAIGAICLRANLPVAIALVWVSNPLTIAPLFYSAYRMGLWLMHRPLPDNNFEFSLEWVKSGIGNSWEPFLLGCLILGMTCSMVGYLSINFFWRRRIAKKWHARKQQRLLKNS